MIPGLPGFLTRGLFSLVLWGSTPVFVATPKIWAVTVSTANTNRDGTGTIATVGSAGANGSRVNWIKIKATADPADGIVNLFLHDGSTYFLFDAVDTGDPAAASATVDSYSNGPVAYDDLVLPTSWSLRAANTVALTAGVFNVIAGAGDL